MRGARRLAAGVCAGALAATVAPGRATAQTDTVTVVPSTRYEAGRLHQTLLGERYRDLWGMPIRVPVLDLGGFDGGLEPVSRGGGQQTRSLRLRGADGREYNFRSVDKWVTPDPREALEGTPVEALVQDQVSSLHPSAVPVATGLLDAVGVLNPAPRLMVMPDDPRLGEHRETFAGMLGTLEVHADESPDGRFDFAGAAEVDGSEDVLELVAASPEDRIDVPAYLRDRLMSLLLGDWDRHAGQFRWARYDRDGARVWVPIPEDRDYAFSDYDGKALAVVRAFLPKLVTFRDRYPGSLEGLTANSAEIDRRLLAGVPRSAWAATAEALRRELTDAEIEAAARRMPAEHYAASGGELVRVLRARRDALPEVADRLYLQLAAEPEVHGTEERERAEVTRRPDGSVRVALLPIGAEGSAAAPLVDRVFVPGETREIVLYLGGGDDIAVVEGTARSSIRVRVVGGAGADTLTDRSRSDAWTTFHDPDPAGSVEGGLRTRVDRSGFVEPVWVPGEVLPPVDWGRGVSWFTPWVGYEGTQGLIVGGGPSWSWYGFRRFPYAGRATLRALYGLGSGNAGLDGVVESVHVGSTASSWLHARVSGLEAFRFHGRGNDTPGGIAGASEIVRYEQRLVELQLRFDPVEGLRLGAGPVLERLDPAASATSHPHLLPADREAYGKVGLAGSVRFDTRPDRGVVEGGFRLEADGRIFPAAWELDSPFARVGATLSASAALPGRAALAARLGGAQIIGDAPLLESVWLGGSETLRGYHYQRFTGDAVLFGSLEARRRLARVRLLLNTDVGLLAFGDAGRVYVDGESTGGWHTGHGAGIWLEAAGRTVSVTYARGERDTIYLKLGAPF